MYSSLYNMKSTRIILHLTTRPRVESLPCARLQQRMLEVVKSPVVKHVYWDGCASPLARGPSL